MTIVDLSFNEDFSFYLKKICFREAAILEKKKNTWKIMSSWQQKFSFFFSSLNQYFNKSFLFCFVAV